MRKIAILGKAMRARATAPFGNPAWEIWGLGWDELPRCTRRFEIHNEPVLDEIINGERVRDKLIRSRAPVYMQRVFEDIPNSRRYPLEEIVEEFGLDYFASTFAFMIAQAIYEKVDKIGIYGVDLNTTEEYSYQRPNAEFWIAMALGRGIGVHIPPQTALLTAPGRYGWDEESYVTQIKATFALRRRVVEQEIAKEGNRAEAEAWMQ